MCSYCGSKSNARVHDLARHTTSLAKPKRGSRSTDTSYSHKKTDNRHGSTGRKGRNVDNIYLNSSSSIKSYHKNASSYTSRSHRPPCQIGHSKCNTPPNRFRPTSSMTSIDNALFDSFCLASKSLTTQCPSISPQLRTTLISTREASLPSIAIRLRWYHSNPYRGQSPPKYGSLPTTQLSVNASTMPHLPQPRSPLPNTYVDEASATLLSSKNWKPRTKGR